MRDEDSQRCSPREPSDRQECQPCVRTERGDIGRYHLRTVYEDLGLQGTTAKSLVESAASRIQGHLMAVLADMEKQLIGGKTASFSLFSTHYWQKMEALRANNLLSPGLFRYEARCPAMIPAVLGCLVDNGSLTKAEEGMYLLELTELLGDQFESMTLVNPYLGELDKLAGGSNG